MPLIADLKTWVDGETLTAPDLNGALSEVRTKTNGFAAFKDQENTFSLAQAFTAGVTVNGGATVNTGGLTVGAGGAAVTGNSAVTGALAVSGALSFGSISVPVGSVVSGTFAAGAFTFPGALTVGGALAVTGTVSGANGAFTGRVTGGRDVADASGTTPIDFATIGKNHYRVRLVGNTTLQFSGSPPAGPYTLEVLQDGTGGRTLAWSNVLWGNGIIPTATSTANRKDVYTFFFDGASYIGGQFAPNIASTS